MTERILNRKIYQAGAVIFKDGDSANDAYLIESGTVEVVRKSGSAEVVLARLTRGEIFGEMALIDGKPRTASVRAVDAVTCVLISQSEFRRKLDAADPLLRRLLQIFVGQIRARTDAAVPRTPASPSPVVAEPVVTH
ncbi:MAG: cyclic nucleotide-binding domain-containing protein [Rhodospirillaceae bacterium]|nr:cyclic nucleotide-binding domain-containing protein [Rhodospirillaceae bacterium]